MVVGIVVDAHGDVGVPILVDAHWDVGAPILLGFWQRLQPFELLDGSGGDAFALGFESLDSNKVGNLDNL